MTISLPDAEATRWSSPASKPGRRTPRARGRCRPGCSCRASTDAGIGRQRQHLGEGGPLDEQLTPRHQPGHELEFGLVELEELGILPPVEGGIREQELRRTAFDDGAQQIGGREIVGRLRRQEHRGVALAPRLEGLLDVRAKRLVLDEPPGFVHDAELQRAGRALGDAAADSVQDVEEQRLEQGGIGAHGFEVEDLERLDVERIVDVVEQVRVASALDPLRQAARQGAGQQVRQGEEPPLGRIEDVEVLDRFVQFAIFERR